MPIASLISHPVLVHLKVAWNIVLAWSGWRSLMCVSMLDVSIHIMLAYNDGEMQTHRHGLVSYTMVTLYASPWSLQRRLWLQITSPAPDGNALMWDILNSGRASIFIYSLWGVFTEKLHKLWPGRVRKINKETMLEKPTKYLPHGTNRITYVLGEICWIIWHYGQKMSSRTSFPSEIPVKQKCMTKMRTLQFIW